METTSRQAGDLAENRLVDVAPDQLRRLWVAARADAYGLTSDEFNAALGAVGWKFNFGLPPGQRVDAAQKAAFLNSLRLEDLALATACRLGREVAWEFFLERYRSALNQAAVAITGSMTLGHDLADSLYAELYGLREVGGERRSPLASYSGRGSLLGWLRSTLAQRFVDHHRRTHRETTLDMVEAAIPEAEPSPPAEELAALSRAVTGALQELPAEERFLLSAYFLDRRPLAQIGRLLQVHEATISRRIQRLLKQLPKRLLHHLQQQGLSRRAAEEALGSDPRDLAINLHTLLQSTQDISFPDKTANA